MNVEVLKATQDDWYGSYTLDGYYKGTEKQMFVCVRFHGNITAYDPTRPPVWRTSVWGNDDCGMEFDCATETECWVTFLQVIGLEFVNRDDLIKLGFVSA